MIDSKSHRPSEPCAGSYVRNVRCPYDGVCVVLKVCGDRLDIHTERGEFTSIRAVDASPTDADGCITEAGPSKLSLALDEYLRHRTVKESSKAMRNGDDADQRGEWTEAALVHFGLAMCLERLGNLDEAVESAEKAIALNGSLTDAYRLASALRRARSERHLERSEKIERQKGTDQCSATATTSTRDCAMAKSARSVKSLRPGTDAPRCGLCGKTKNLVRTECCGNWICDDESTYVMFSYACNSCHRNHNRYTLCAHHHIEGHAGDWKTCRKCRAGCETEMYVWYGTNEYNFEKLESPPSFTPTHCAKCRAVISLANDGYSISAKGYLCDSCSQGEMEMARSKRATMTDGPRDKIKSGKPMVEEEYVDVLRDPEMAIVGLHKRHASLLDLEVLEALEGLIRVYAWEKEGRGVPSSRLSDRPHLVFEACRRTCECWLGRQQFTPDEIRERENVDKAEITLPELFLCLKRNRSSVRLWNKEGGRQGYLNYVRQFLDAG